MELNLFDGQFLPGQIGLKVTQQSLRLLLNKLLPLREERSDHQLEDDLGAGGEGGDEQEQQQELQEKIEGKKVEKQV